MTYSYKVIFLFFILFLSNSCSNVVISTSRSVAEEDFATSCIGPKEARSFLIYLHGMDSNPPSSQEINNRIILKKFAEQKNIRIALPRATDHCPNSNLYCWGWKFDPDELKKIVPIISDARKNCFDLEKPFGILGFSNGGYLLTHLYLNMTSFFPNFKPNLLMTSGSAKGNISSINLSTNPLLVIIIGKQDQYNYDPDETFFHQLQANKAPVKLIEFEGGHTLDLESLLKTF